MAAGTLKGWASTGASRIEVDRKATSLRVRNRVGKLAPSAIRDTPEGWCVDTAALSAWLGVTLVADQSNVLLFVQSDTKLSIELTQERRARAAAIRPKAAIVDPAKLPRVKLPYLMRRTPSLDAVVTVNGIRDSGNRTGHGWRGTLGLEHGLDALHLGGRAAAYARAGERTAGAVRRAVGSALVELFGAYEQSGGMAARTQMLAQFDDIYVSAESIKGYRGFRSDRIEPAVTGRHVLAIDHSFLFAHTMSPTHVKARYIERRDRPDTLEAVAQLSSNLQNFSITAGLGWQSQRARGRDPPGATPTDRLGAAVLVNGRVGRVRMRGEARYRLSSDERGFDGATLVGKWGASQAAQ